MIQGTKIPEEPTFRGDQNSERQNASYRMFSAGKGTKIPGGRGPPLQLPKIPLVSDNLVVQKIDNFWEFNGNHLRFDSNFESGDY